MIDGNAVEAARDYLRENDPQGLKDHLNSIGYEVNTAKMKMLVRELLKEDGYTEAQIINALMIFD